MKEHYLKIDEHSIAAFEYNAEINSTPLIFIHGIGSAIHSWEPIQIQHVREQYHWYSLSLPGHWPARFPDGFHREQMIPSMFGKIMSDSIRQLTDGVPVILIGHSTGGFASYCIAHHAPELVERLIIVEGFSQGRWHGTLGPLQIAANLPIAGNQFFDVYYRIGISSFVGFRTIVLSWAADKSAVTTYPGFDTIARETLALVRQTDRQSLAHYYSVMPHTDISNWLKEIEIPTHIIHGSKDAIIKPDHAHDMHNLLPNSTLTWIDGSGHLPMFERPKEYQAAIVEALS